MSYVTKSCAWTDPLKVLLNNLRFSQDVVLFDSINFSLKATFKSILSFKLVMGLYFFRFICSVYCCDVV